ncbi:glycosyltransferase [Salegentibacter agarivorans]|uniref:Glycosyltransferase, GT2 family n=1 Tax=Salegentibacter agarivorans TaxID=345907 RepID=A0A1I2KZN1_9FLAO|nr:glycosyltransferase [Salegentibacter agarivorans]SFF72532.1 Glycosyltransferase, GT2 family [Salegentibacter agarivorans]|tara:strand:+ start:342 stop:1349 length:1008 start_codon:yes stop_codon:yes gene_type:complete
MKLNYSFIIPVYNRPGEVRELLESMLKLKFDRDFEIVLVEDGSSISSGGIATEFQQQLNISYHYKKNTGPGDSRNFGMRKAKGNYFLILDSDVLLPENYLQEVDKFLQQDYCDCFGGPDASHPSFSKIQKAIDYSMTSFLTTGGIRGKKSAVNDFQPRSFNMGISKNAFEASGGFGKIHPGEDPDLSLRLKKMGYKLCLIPGAVVFHKRRIDWSKFYTQVQKFGMVRPILNKWHPGSGKITYWFPAVFSLGFLFAILLLKLGIWWLFLLYVLYFVIIAIDAAIKNKSLGIGFLAVYATLVQFFGYGYGFIKSLWHIHILKQDPEHEFPNLFFKNV